MTWIALGTEDELSEAIGKRLLEEAGTTLVPWPLLRQGGFGYLKSKMNNWRALARQQPVVLITDLDTATCPAQLLADWLGTPAPPANLVIRVAVREIESWILADHVAMRTLIGPKGKLPIEPDALADPKQHLLRLVAKHAQRSVQNDLLVQKGVVASQGLGYNAVLCEFVAKSWAPERAASRSESLHRARNRLQEFARRVVPE